MSDSDSRTSTQTSSNVTNLDNRVGVEGTGNIIAGSNAAVQVTNNDLSADGLDMLIRGNAFVSDAAISAGQESARVAASAAVTATNNALASNVEANRIAAGVAVNALGAVQEASRLAVSGVVTGQARALDTTDRALSFANNASEDAFSTARLIATSNNELTEKTRQGNQELVKLVADKLSTAAVDERKNINAELVDTAAKYGTAALVVVTLIIGITLYRRKAA